MIKLGIGQDGWTRYYCTVCGHVEWVAPGEDIPAHYRCPLCGEGRSVMLRIDDARLARHRVEFKAVAQGVWRTDKRPDFHPEWQHHSYVLAHRDGVVLYDAPPLVTDEAIEMIRSLGRPRLLVVSHQDFVGCAADWAHALDIPAWFGEGDEPLPGNRFVPDERINSVRRLAGDLEVVPVPGHSPGSLAVYWSGAAEGAVLCSGDAITVWHHGNGRVQLAYFQDPPAGAAIAELSARPVRLLASCGGFLLNAAPHLRRLLETENNCARPYRGEEGGVWLDHASISHNGHD